MARDLIKFAYEGIIIYIDAASVKENYTNAITPITIPTTEDSPNTTSLINLNKVEDRFTITGFISEGKYLDVKVEGVPTSSTETYTTAVNKKDGLKTMYGKGNVVVMTWEGADYNVAVDKYEISFIAKDDKDTTQSGTIVYDVTISCIVGSDLI